MRVKVKLRLEGFSPIEITRLVCAGVLSVREMLEELEERGIEPWRVRMMLTAAGYKLRREGK